MTCFVRSDWQVVKHRKGFHLNNLLNIIVVVLLFYEAGVDTGLRRVILRNRSEHLLYLFCSLFTNDGYVFFSQVFHFKQLDLLPGVTVTC